MTAGSTKEKKADPEVVEKIINTLKSKGCFDQFRKEFIAEADTKPAYHNLQQRVEAYVSRFLSQQKWSPKLNKNQLRETLRRQINQSGMLNKGVERIVEQTINPKIMQLIKPKTDEVTCEHLNISLTEHKNALRRKQQEQHEKMLKSPETAGIQSLLSINFSSPPPGSSAPPFSNTSSPAMPPGQFNPAPPGSGILGPTPGQYQPQLAFTSTNPAGLSFPSISQQSFPFLPPGWNASLNAGFPPLFPGQLQFQTFGIPPPGAALNVPPPAAGGLLIPPVSSSVLTNTSLSTKASPAKGLKGLNALLGLPTPSEEPAPPGTLVLPDGTHVLKKRPVKIDTEDNESAMHTADSDLAERAVNEQIQKAFHEEMEKAAKGDHVTDDQGGDSKRQYRFAWDEDIQEVDLEDSIASSDVSSVHTSDLSHFEESESSSDSDLEGLQQKLLLLEKKQQEKAQESKISAQSESFESSKDEVVDSTPAVLTEASMTQLSPVKTAANVGTELEEKIDARRKPRKLVSLQYKYSDSEDEETREERKARIAKEKEDRYQRRLHRRAELEAKRKERDEEKLRLKREKLERAREAQEKSEKENAEKAVTLPVEKKENDEKQTEQIQDNVEELGEAEKQTGSINESADIMETMESDDRKLDIKDEPVATETEQETTKAAPEHEAGTSSVDENKDDTAANKEAKDGEKTDITDLNTSEGNADTSLNTESSATAGETTIDTSVADGQSSPEKKKQKKKTKEELKAELKEQKVMERKSRRQRIRNKRYMSDEFVLPTEHLTRSYDDPMVIEETIEMVEIDSEQQTFEIDGSQVELVEIPLPDEGDGQSVAMETVEFVMPEDGGEVIMTEGETYLVTDSADGDQDLQIEGETVIEEDTAPTEMVEVTMADTVSSQSGRVMTRSHSKATDDMTSNSSSQSVRSEGDGRRKRKRNMSQSSAGEEPVSKKQPTEGRQLRSRDSKADRQDSKSRKKSYTTDDLYKPRHSFSRKSVTTPPPLPNEPPPPPAEPEPSPPPLPPLPPPPAEPPGMGNEDELPQAPESPDASDSDVSSKESTKDDTKRKHRSRSRSESRKQRLKSRSKSTGTVSSHSRRRSHSSRSSYSKRSGSSRSRSRSLSSISSESRSHSRSRSRSYSRSYSRSRSRSRSSSGSRSVSRSRSRSISSVSSKRSAYSDDSEERRRKARPLEEVDFGEAAKRARQNAMMAPFGPRGPLPMGPRPPMVPMGPRGPIGPGPYPMRGMPPMVRGPRGMIRGRFPSPGYVGPDGSPIRPPAGSPGKPYFVPGGPRYMPPAPPWEDSLRSRPPFEDDDYYPPEDIHEGPGKTGITERGTLYREDKSPTPPPERRPMYSPPPPSSLYHEGSASPPIPTGITERGTLYREDTSPSPPPMYRRRLEDSPSPPMRPRHRMDSLTPTPPPILRKRTRSTRSGSFESISPSPPRHPVRQRSITPQPRTRRITMSPPVVQRNTPPVLRHTRTEITGTPSPPSSGELTPSPPDLRDRSHSPVSPGPLGPVSPLSPGAPASPVDSLSSASPLSEAPTDARVSPRRSRRHREMEPASPDSSSEIGSPVRLKKRTRKTSSVEEESVQLVRESKSRHKKSKRKKR